MARKTREWAFSGGRGPSSVLRWLFEHNSTVFRPPPAVCGDYNVFSYIISVQRCLDSAPSSQAPGEAPRTRDARLPEDDREVCVVCADGSVVSYVAFDVFVLVGTFTFDDRGVGSFERTGPAPSPLSLSRLCSVTAVIRLKAMSSLNSVWHDQRCEERWLEHECSEDRIRRRRVTGRHPRRRTSRSYCRFPCRLRAMRSFSATAAACQCTSGATASCRSRPQMSLGFARRVQQMMENHAPGRARFASARKLGLSSNPRIGSSGSTRRALCGCQNYIFAMRSTWMWLSGWTASIRSAVASGANCARKRAHLASNATLDLVESLFIQFAC